MPTISMFYGIIILMHLTRKEHNPPHIHALYQDYEAMFSIKTGEIIYGNFPFNGSKLVKQFVEIHRDELMEMWVTEVYKKIQPLI